MIQGLANRVRSTLGSQPSVNPPVSPMPGSNQVDAAGQVSADSVASEIVDQHKKALRARYERDLLSEKYLLHIDGSGDFQWAEILNGTRVEVPRLVSEYRKTENVLRLVVDNAVAYHTSMPLRYFADGGSSRQSRDLAAIDTIWANHLASRQHLNDLFAEALYMAMPAGFCPAHGYWRDDVTKDFYEPATAGPTTFMGPGMVDCFVGNPFTTAFDVLATRNSIRWASYERVLPAAWVRQWFGHVPGIEGMTGSTKLPSATEFQRIARQWQSGGLGLHGSPVLTDRRDSREEVLSLIVRETAPGADSRWPEGRLQIVVVPGAVDIRQGEGNSSHALLVADQKLPGGDFSFENFYSHHRGSDIHGKPWVEDLDQMQVSLNIALSKRWEAINRMMNAPIVSPGGAMNEDMMDLDGYGIIEIEPSLASWRPEVMRWPEAIVTGLDKEIEDKRRAIFTAGGYQASSRGEAPGSRMAYRAIIALQQADNTIHGPVNLRFQRSSVGFMQKCHGQMRTYGDVPWLVDVVGEEYSYLAEPYIDKTKMSTRPPNYKLVNAFGTTPEMRAQEILELVAMVGADGQPFLTTEEARSQYPNALIFNRGSDPRTVQRRRARTIAVAIHQKAQEFVQETQMEEDLSAAHPWVQQAGMQVFMWAEQVYPRKRDDLLDEHINSLSEITQDETANPIARVAAELRQSLYYQWQAMMAGIPIEGQALGAGGGGDAPTGMGSDRRAIAAQSGADGNIALAGVEGG